MRFHLSPSTVMPSYQLANQHHLWLSIAFVNVFSRDFVRNKKIERRNTNSRQILLIFSEDMHSLGNIVSLPPLFLNDDRLLWFLPKIILTYAHDHNYTIDTCIHHHLVTTIKKNWNNLSILLVSNEFYLFSLMTNGQYFCVNQ